MRMSLPPCRELANSIASQADYEAERGATERSIELLKEAAQILRQSPATTSRDRDLASVHESLAKSLDTAGRAEEAHQVMETVRAIRSTLPQTDHTPTEQPARMEAGMPDDAPPATNEVAEALWNSARAGASMAELLELASTRLAGAEIQIISALLGAFDLPLGEAKIIVGTWAGLSSTRAGSSSEEIESQFGERVRNAIRPRLRRTHWVKCPDGGWEGRTEPEA